jgi:hypothetical protein
MLKHLAVLNSTIMVCWTVNATTPFWKKKKDGSGNVAGDNTMDRRQTAGLSRKLQFVTL